MLTSVALLVTVIINSMLFNLLFSSPNRFLKNTQKYPVSQWPLRHNIRTVTTGDILKDWNGSKHISLAFRLVLLGWTRGTTLESYAVSGNETFWNGMQTFPKRGTRILSFPPPSLQSNNEVEPWASSFWLSAAQHGMSACQDAVPLNVI